MGFVVLLAIGIRSTIYPATGDGPTGVIAMRRYAQVILDKILSRSALTICLCALLFTGLLSSASRAPVVSVVFSVVVVSAVGVVANQRRLRIRLWGVLGCLFAGLLLGTEWPSLRRLSAAMLYADERWRIWITCVDYFKDHWLWGSGPGSFASVFATYRTGNLRPLHYDHAHNDYLEFILEHGVLGSAPFALGGILLLVCVLCKRSGTDSVPELQYVCLAAALGCIAMLVHASVDFVFHVPANAMAFMMLLGCGLGARVWAGQRLTSRNATID
jgi:O-antigen ligase